MSSIYPDGGHRREGSSGDALDRWYTPDDVARACVRTLWRGERPPMWCVEPSVGGGAFARAMRAEWPAAHILGVDIDPEAKGLRDCDEMRVGSWLTPGQLDEALPCQVVAMNPPYRDAVAHIGHAIQMARGYSRTWAVGALVRVALLEGVSRTAWWRAHPPAEVHHLRRRVSFGGPAAAMMQARTGKPPGTDYAAYAWMVWRPEHAWPWWGATHMDIAPEEVAP